MQLHWTYAELTTIVAGRDAAIAGTSPPRLLRRAGGQPSQDEAYCCGSCESLVGWNVLSSPSVGPFLRNCCDVCRELFAAT